MAFLALASQKSLMMLQKNFLQFQQTVIMQNQQVNAAEIAALQKEHPDDYQEMDAYLACEQLDEQYGAQKDSLDSQITALDSEISSLKTLVQNNIKSGCTLNLIGS